MWYTTKRFALIFTDTSIYALIYTRRQLIASQHFSLDIATQPGVLLDWLWEHGKTHMAGVFCLPHTACEVGILTLQGQQDRYACYQQLKDQISSDTWLDYQLYYDKPAKQTRVYWYALPKYRDHDLVEALESSGFNVRAISTVPLMLRYAAAQQADRQGVSYLYHDDQTLHFCVYQNRLIVNTVEHPCEALDQYNMQAALNSVQQQVPLANQAQYIACTTATQKLCQEMHFRAASLNTAWDENIAKGVPEYVRLAGGLVAREWHELAA